MKQFMTIYRGIAALLSVGCLLYAAWLAWHGDHKGWQSWAIIGLLWAPSASCKCE